MQPSHDTGADFEPCDDSAVATANVYAARAFGASRADLDLDLSDSDRPGLVTRLLALCLARFTGVPDAEAVAWDWTVAERLQGLLAIVLATRTDLPPVSTRCQASGCRTSMQIELDLTAFVAEARRDPVVCRVAGDQRVTARLPRGVDQRHWRDTKADSASMATRLVERVEGRIPERGWRVPPDWLDQLAAALAERDPLTALQLSAACPNCGHINVVDFDLEGWLLRLLAEAQDGLLDDVHGLAVAYHWGEADICALPAQRRRAYLARLEREERR
jgi:hypothetical protein